MLTGKTVGVVSGNQRTLAGRQRLAGFQNAVCRKNVQILQQAYLAKTEAELEKEMKTPPDILVALDSSAMETGAGLSAEEGSFQSPAVWRRAFGTGGILPGPRSDTGNGRAG